jgi:hypothetical protein
MKSSSQQIGKDVIVSTGTKYMVIDATVLQETRVIAVAPLREATAIGRIQKAAGREIICPPVEGRGFAKLTLQQLQYLFWNATQTPPLDDFGALTQAALAAVDAIPLDATPLAALEKQVAKLYPDGSTPSESAATAGGEPKEKRAPHVPGTPHERPKATTTTGLVWDIADSVLGKLHPALDATIKANGVVEFPAAFDWKAVREALMVACETEGINKATAATQYSKWKGAKLSAKTA